MSWKQKFEHIFFPINAKNVLLLLFFWLLTGFTMGTATLVGPARWISNASGNGPGESSLENWLIRLLILLLVVTSFLVALWLTRGVSRSTRTDVRLGVPALLILFTLGNLYFWFNPQQFRGYVSGVFRSVGQFTFGPYPSLEDMQKLKQQGYTAIISLLHPAVVPFEPGLWEKEKQNAERVGIPLIHLPMLPWVSENKAALDSIRTLATRTKGRYYVHCYLGRDRVGVVRELVERVNPIARVRSLSPDSSRWDLHRRNSLERGKVVELDSNLFLTPYPTDEEYFAYILTSDVKFVVSLMDSTRPKDKPWIEKERKILRKYLIPFRNWPIPTWPFKPDSVLQIARRLRYLPRPAVVHGFLSRGSRWEGIIQAFRSNKPPLPPTLFRDSLAQGQAEVIAPNMAVGPRPVPREFGGVLYNRGVRRYLYLGNADSSLRAVDSLIAHRSGIPWQSFAGSARALFKHLEQEPGPWYLYGPNLSRLLPALKAYFGPPIPEKIIFDLSQLPPPPPEWRSGKTFSSHRVKGLPGLVQRFIQRGIPDLFMLLILTPMLVLYAALSAALAGWFRSAKNVRTPYTRKIFHLFIFTMASVLQFTLGLSAVILFGSVVALAVLYAVYRGDGFPFYEAMARPTDAPHRTLFIIIPLLTTAVGGVLANLFFPNFSYIGYLVGGWGDAVGEPVGARWGKHKYTVPSLAGVRATRSVEGSTAVFLLGALVALVGLLAGGYSFAHSLTVALATALAATAVEAISNHGLDNLTIQLVASGVVTWLIG